MEKLPFKLNLDKTSIWEVSSVHNKNIHESSHHTLNVAYRCLQVELPNEIVAHGEKLKTLFAMQQQCFFLGKDLKLLLFYGEVPGTSQSAIQVTPRIVCPREVLPSENALAAYPQALSSGNIGLFPDATVSSPSGTSFKIEGCRTGFEAGGWCQTN